MEVKIEMFLDIKDGNFDEIKKMEHHAEYFLNLDEYPEIESVYGVKVEKTKNKK